MIEEVNSVVNDGLLSSLPATVQIAAAVAEVSILPKDLQKLAQDTSQSSELFLYLLAEGVEDYER